MTTKNIHQGIPASRAFVDPMRQLFAAVVCQAVRDLAAEDMIKALDALCFWLDDHQGGLSWLDALEDDFPSDPDIVFRCVIGGASDEKKLKFGRVVKQRAVKNGRKPGGDVPAGMVAGTVYVRA
jgi:hypothetical protein